MRMPQPGNWPPIDGKSCRYMVKDSHVVDSLGVVYSVMNQTSDSTR